MTPLPIEGHRLPQLLAHLRIVHHVQGRLRVRLLPKTLEILPLEHRDAPKVWLMQIPGVIDARFNLAAASLVIQYDVNQIQPQWWERLLAVSDQELPALLAEIGVSIKI